MQQFDDELFVELREKMIQQVKELKLKRKSMMWIFFISNKLIHKNTNGQQYTGNGHL